MFTIEIVILTKSSKNGDFCVAGIDLETRDWVRLVSENEKNDGAITERQMRDINKHPIEPLDVVRVVVKEHAPLGCQSENYIISSTHTWKKVGKLQFSQILSICSVVRTKYIFGSRYKSLSEAEISNLTRSLMLVEVTNLHVYRNELGKCKCDFEYSGCTYSEMSMTDPDYYEYDSCEFEKAHIVVSLPHTDFNGRYYKFVAKIFPQRPESFRRRSLSDLLN